MNGTSRSVDRVGTACVGAADRRMQLSRGRSETRRLTSRGSASSRPGTFVRTQTESREWEALQEMFLASRRRYLGLAYSVLKNKEDAEDAVQDALLSAYRHLRGFEGRSAITTWFTRIVLNAALMIRRKRKHSRIESLPETSATDDMQWIDRIPASEPDPEITFAQKETFRWIDIVLEKMSPVLRQAFTMTYYDEKSSEEASAVLGVTTGTFKSRLFRARQHLMNQAQRAFANPIRGASHFQFSFGGNDFPTLVARPAEIRSREISFS